MLSRLAGRLLLCWYQRPTHFITFLFSPLAALFWAISTIRRKLYQSDLLTRYRSEVPVIVVGNITIGGTGKTPFVIWLAQYLLANGYRPGIVARGVGSKKKARLPHLVASDDSPQQVGDEALLLLRNTGCPVVIGVDRALAVQSLLDAFPCDVVISDDGLQHYRLHRDIEIVMVDASRGFGNHYLLPAGPLREPVSRLRTADFIVRNGGDQEDENENDQWVMQLTADHLVSLKDPQKKVPLGAFPKEKIHAVAAIGHPQQFFKALVSAGFDIIAHAFPDHYLYQAEDLHFADAYAVLMTEKDAVKYCSFADARYWYLSASVKVNEKLGLAILQKLNRVERSCHR